MTDRPMGPREVNLGAREAPTDRPPRGWVLYVDLDAYYVACELRDRPDLIGRPVIVGPKPTETPSRGVVLSASYEARAFGVRSALPARTAARLCPDAVWIPADFPKYERISRDVRALLRDFSPEVVPYSIDECALTVPDASPEAARELGRSVQTALRDRLGLGASIGIATSRVVAKMASDRAKPGGLVVVRPSETSEFLAPLPVRAIPGVGPKTEEILRRRSIGTIRELAAHEPSDLLRDLGGFARELIALARGAPAHERDSPNSPHSRSVDRTFDRDAPPEETLLPVVRELANGLAANLETEGLRYASVGVAFRWSDFDRSQRSHALSAAQEGPGALASEAARLAERLLAQERAGRKRWVRTVSVRAERLSGRGLRQASLDEYPASPVRRVK